MGEWCGVEGGCEDLTDKTETFPPVAGIRALKTGMCRSAMKAINCQQFLCHNFKAAASLFARPHFERPGAHFSRRTCLVFLCFSLLSRSGSGSVSFFHHKLVKQVTLLLIGWVPSVLHRNWPASQRLSLALSLQLCLSLVLAVLQGRVVCHDDFSGKEC